MKFTDLLDQYHIPYKREGEHHHARSGWVQLDCPHCSKNWNRYRMGFNLNSGYVTCWVCGHHSLKYTISLLLNISVREAEMLTLGLDEGYQKQEQKAPVHRKLVVPGPRQPLHRVHREYLLERGFDPDEITRVWGVDGFTHHGKYPWRLFIPICDRYGQIMSWTTRSIADNSSARYSNAPEEEEALSAKSLLYGEHLVPSHAICIVEGPTDAWRLGPGAVATMGLKITSAQLLKISKYPVRLICLDNEPVAQKVAKDLCRNFACLSGRTINIRLDSKDPGCAIDREIQKVRKLISSH